MSGVPDVTHAADAVSALATWVRAELAAPGHADVLPDQLVHAAGVLVPLVDDATWCRDGLLVVARNVLPPVHWDALAAGTNVAVSTLIGRMQRWEHRQRTGVTR